MREGLLDRLFSLEGRVAIVTGASRGIGEAVAEGLARVGAHVVGVGRSSAPSHATIERQSYKQCDVLDAASFRALCSQAFAERGRLDILVQAAGVSLAGQPQDDPLAIFARSIDVNLKAPYSCSLVASEFMKRGAGGSIVNVTSINSILGFPNNPGYVASKGGLRMLSRALAVDLAPHGIRVNNLAPGYIRTAMTEESYRNPALREERLRRTILKRWGTPEDLVGTAIYLASDASSYVTGQDFFVDGGWTALGLG